MTEIWWLIDQGTRVGLANLQWKRHRTKLDAIDMPLPTVDSHDPELEPEPDPELVRDMAKPPHSPRQVG